MRRLVLFVAAMLVAAGAAAADFVVPLPGRESVVIPLPAGWQGTLRPGPADRPPTVEIRGADRRAFQVLVTPAALPEAATADEVRGAVERAAREAASRAVERELPLQSLVGSGKSGFYFSATDRSPEPDGYAHLTQGLLGFGELRLFFTILVNGDPAAVTQPALQMLRNTRRGPPTRETS